MWRLRRVIARALRAWVLLGSRARIWPGFRVVGLYKLGYSYSVRVLPGDQRFLAAKKVLIAQYERSDPARPPWGESGYRD